MAATPYVYQASDSAHIGGIYAYEAPAYNVHEEATCLVIGGSYKGEPTTYYRVDFIDTDGNYLELLRNHIYTFKITAVGGEGYEDEEEAFKSKSVNMTVEVVKWDQGDMQDFVFDGQYILGVSKSLIEFDKAASQDIVIVTTDYPQGWVATVDQVTYPWLSIVSQNFSGINQKDDLVIGVIENDTNAERTGYIDVTAGRLTHSLKVVQRIGSSASLSILDANDNTVSNIGFITYLGQTSITPQLFKVVWTPATSDCVISEVVTGRTGFDCGAGDNPAATLTIQGGTKSYTLQPDPVLEAELDLSESGDPFLLKQSRYTFTVDNLEQHIVVGEQVVGVFAYPAAAYPIDGGSYSYTVKSNVA
ncbi:MAG: BACON domain-containing protein [Tannerellaceae bacterium]|nr:BACON domain-containing protein [Tannerellaceae bacterium]